MLTHNDLLKCSNDETMRMNFVFSAITEFKGSEDYKTADISMQYYKKQNPDISAVEKIIYDMKGVAHRDLISPNAKLRCCYYPQILNESVAHLLTNGVGFNNDSNKEKLGADFDDTLKDIYLDALVCGRSWGIYDFKKNKVKQLKYFNFAPIWDDFTGALAAGVYFTQIAENKPLCAYLYEADGITEYIQDEEGTRKVSAEKRPYKLINVDNKAEGIYSSIGENPSMIPIYPLFNLNEQSSIIGVHEDLAALDLMASQLVNNVSQAELVYWVLKNYGGMDDIADANFIVNLIKSHIIHVDDDGDATPHQITVPFEANEAAYARIKTIIFDNLCGVNHEKLDAGNLTATAIAAAYSKQRNFSAMMESNVFKFIRGMLEIIGVTENEKFTVEYYETINATEAIQNTIVSAPYLGDTETTKRLAILNGSGERIEEIFKEKEAEQLMQFSAAQNAQDNADGGSNLLGV